MAESSVWTGIDELSTIADSAQESIRTAVQFEVQTKGLHELSLRSVDHAISQAVKLLMTDYEAGLLTPRESFEAVLAINQFKPHNVWWTGAPNIPKMLNAFDLLYEPGTPHIIPDSYGRLYAGITSHKTPSLEIAKERQGASPLPDALITFGSFVVSGEIRHPNIANEEGPKIVSLYELGKSAVGAVAIQEYINTLELQIHEYECGHGYTSNENKVQTAYNIACLLANARKFRLDTRVIKAQLKIADERRKTEEARRRHRMRYSSKTPVIDRFIRFR